jgi:septum formation protein
MSALAAAPLVLASASRARALLLRQAGLEVITDPAGIDEAKIKASCQAAARDPADCATMLAEAKAARVAERHAGKLVIGADQLLVCGAAWFDKPGDHAGARRQLQCLAGKRHELVTAATVCRDRTVLWRHVERPALTMRRFDERFLDAYLAAAGDGVLGAVGAYELEGLGVQLFERIEGDYFSILGLPLLPLLGFLRQAGAVTA